jgi:Trk K+ transport system NAD-binding subunit
VATAHYARRVETNEQEEESHKTYNLARGVDEGKDQSYFLWTLTAEQLQYIEFPIGDMPKSNTRKLAVKYNLPTATKKDSQGICFIGEIDMKDFLHHYIEQKRGDVLDTNGNAIGHHDGALFFTLGERHGFTITETGTDDAARYVVANLSDPQNANICLTLRSICDTPIVALVRDPDHQKLLRQAGANHVIAMPRILGRFLATRATTRGAMAHVLDTFGALQIAEFPVNGTPFAGMTLEQAQIRQKTGLSVIGLWKRGQLTIPHRDTILDEDSLALLAGSSDQLKGLEKLIGDPESSDLIFVLGHGRIGCAAATFLERKPAPFVLIDQSESSVCHKHVPVIGDATSRTTLTDAGIANATGVIVTTNDDSINVFLTLASRYMHPNIRIVARANEDENVDQLYAAGADFVVSNSSVGTSILMNLIDRKASVFLSEGMNIFKRRVPKALGGKQIIESGLRNDLGCSIIALKHPNGHMDTSPEPDTVLQRGVSMLLIGSVEHEKAFDERYPRAHKSK